MYISTPPLSQNVAPIPPSPLPPPNVSPDVVPEGTGDDEDVYEKIIENLKGALNQQQMGAFARKLAESHGTCMQQNTAMATSVLPEEEPSELYQEFQPPIKIKLSHPQAMPTINPSQQMTTSVPGLQTQLIGQDMYEDAATPQIKEVNKDTDNVYDEPDPQNLCPEPESLERKGKSRIAKVISLQKSKVQVISLQTNTGSCGHLQMLQKRALSIKLSSLSHMEKIGEGREEIIL